MKILKNIKLTIQPRKCGVRVSSDKTAKRNSKYKLDNTKVDGGEVDNSKPNDNKVEDNEVVEEKNH